VKLCHINRSGPVFWDTVCKKLSCLSPQITKYDIYLLLYLLVLASWSASVVHIFFDISGRMHSWNCWLTLQSRLLPEDCSNCCPLSAWLKKSFLVSSQICLNKSAQVRWERQLNEWRRRGWGSHCHGCLTCMSDTIISVTYNCTTHSCFPLHVAIQSRECDICLLSNLWRNCAQRPQTMQFFYCLSTKPDVWYILL